MPHYSLQIYQKSSILYHKTIEKKSHLFVEGAIAEKYESKWAHIFASTCLFRPLLPLPVFRGLTRVLRLGFRFDPTDTLNQGEALSVLWADNRGRHESKWAHIFVKVKFCFCPLHT